MLANQNLRIYSVPQKPHLTGKADHREGWQGQHGGEQPNVSRLASEHVV